MRDCTEFEALISAFIDGDLREEDRGTLMEHMAACPACQNYFDDQIAIHAALSDMAESEAPAGLADGVMAQIRAGKKKKVIQFPQWRRVAAMAACCAVVVLGVWATGGMKSMAPLSRTDNAAPAVRAAMDKAVATEGFAMDDADTGAVPEDAQAAPTALPGAANFAALRGAVSADGPVARAWVEEELALPWTPGEKYELTGEQFEDLLAALKEAGEMYATPAPGAESQGYWIIMK